MYDIILAFITAFSITYFAIPSIIHIAQVKQLVDRPNERSSHSTLIPSLGGIGIFAGALFAITFWTPFEIFEELKYILCALIIMFLIGAKDDIVPVSPKTKFIAQILAAAILVMMADVKITSFYGLVGIHDLPNWFSIPFSIVVIVFIINAFNLIDGINGLAGSISSIIAITFGVWFFLIDRLELAIIAFSLVGAIVAFLKYNYSPAKIFMGDTGSLLVGLVCAMLALTFMEVNNGLDSIYAVEAVPAVTIGIIIVPVVDTLRVFTTRILKGKSPFHPDKTHIHHLLLRLGFSHMQGTGILSFVNIIFILVAYSLQGVGTSLGVLIILGLALLLTGVLYYLVKRKESENRELASSNK